MKPPIPYSRANAPLRERLTLLGVAAAVDQAALQARIERHRLAGESLKAAYERQLLEWFDAQAMRIEAPSTAGTARSVAAAEAAVALSGVAARWPERFLATRPLPVEDLRRLYAALPDPAPPVRPRAMPEQPLQAWSLRDLLPAPSLPRLPQRARVRLS